NNEIIIGIRPEDIFPSAQNNEGMAAAITVAELTGAEYMLYCCIGGNEITVRGGPDDEYHAAQAIYLQFNMSKSHFFDAASEVKVA
ncbi:TOBE domain-containing protein, partial [Aeromonas caviae]